MRDSNGASVSVPATISSVTSQNESIATLGAAAHELRGRSQGRRVGMMGMSFAGGLALVAAADPTYAEDIGFVVSVGGHDDLGRVLRFFESACLGAVCTGFGSPLAPHAWRHWTKSARRGSPRSVLELDSQDSELFAQSVCVQLVERHA